MRTARTRQSGLIYNAGASMKSPSLFAGQFLIAWALVCSGPALAADNSSSAIALHIPPHGTPATCTLPSLRRHTIQTDTSEPFTYVYLLVCNASAETGISGLECGLSYQGGASPVGGESPINIFSWHFCADHESSTNGWPAPLSGNRISWDANHCQRTRSDPSDSQSVIAIAGYFYVGIYDVSRLRVWAHPEDSKAQVTDCNGNAADLTHLEPLRMGQAGFEGAGGYNPCFPYVVPTERRSWSSLKAGYR